MTHRTPRAHLSSEVLGEQEGDMPPVAPALVEWLDRNFPISLSPQGSEVLDQARQRGQREVIDLLRGLTKTTDQE